MKLVSVGIFEAAPKTLASLTRHQRQYMLQAATEGKSLAALSRKLQQAHKLSGKDHYLAYRPNITPSHAKDLMGALNKRMLSIQLGFKSWMSKLTLGKRQEVTFAVQPLDEPINTNLKESIIPKDTLQSLRTAHAKLGGGELKTKLHRSLQHLETGMVTKEDLVSYLEETQAKVSETNKAALDEIHEILDPSPVYNNAFSSYGYGGYPYYNRFYAPYHRHPDFRDRFIWHPSHDIAWQHNRRWHFEPGF